MSFAQFIPNFPVVVPSVDWSDLTDAVADLEAQWEFDFGTARTIVVHFWEGPGDPDDFAKLTVTTGTAAETIGFTSAPAVGTPVYVVSITFS